MLENIKKSLELKSILWLCLVLVVILTTITTMNIKEQNKVLLERGQDTANRLKESILTAMRHPMMEGDQEIIQLQFNEYKKLKDIVKISLIDDVGIIRRSSDKSLLGQKSDSLHLKAALEGKEFHIIETLKDTGDKVFTEIKPIFNEKRCHGCHGSDKQILGVLKIYLNWEPVLKTVNTTKNRNILLSLFGLLIIGIFNIIFLLKVIIFPIKKLEVGMEKVSAGDLDHKVITDSEDEIGQLTHLFNKMTGDLKILVEKEQKKTEEVALLNQNLKKEITERKKVEEALRESQGYLENLFSYANAPIIVWGSDFVITRFNHAFEELTGISAEEAIGKHLEILFPEESCETSMAMINKTLSGERWEVVEIPIRRKSGEVRIVLWNSANVFGQDGNTIIATIAQGMDITERKKMEDSLKASENKYRVLVENLPQRVFFKGKDSVYVSCNENYARDLKINPDEITGKTDYDFYPQGLAEKYRADDKRIMESGKREEIEEKYIRDGQEFIVFTVKTPVRDQNGNIAGIFGIFWDITERKKIEEQIRNYSIELEKSNKELDDFTYIISHDLKEPLRSIDAFSGFVLDDYKDKLDAEGKNYLERIRVNAIKMQELIEDLLDITRIERKRNPFEEIETGELVKEVKLRLEYAIKEKNVELIVSDSLPRIFCDRVRLTEVFANLVSNAIKFNDKPKPVIEIGCSEKDGFYEFYVKDNGPGIEEQYFEKIFEIFQRLGHREETEGTGAGLTIARKIVQMHKGKVWVESKVGEGATFYFTIPVKAESIQGTAPKESLFTKEEVQKVTDKG
jgi:PAS domain S-box-containing protein